MILPLEILARTHAADLAVAVAIGFAFGFVLERAGFGCAPKLAAQFYGTDLTVLKVMFSAIVTAALGSVVLSGIGVLDLGAVARAATTSFRVWPTLLGGLLLGIGFILSGYCPGTSLVAAASGKLDGAVAAAGVVAGTLLYGEAMALAPFAAFTRSADLGRLSLPDLLRLPAAGVAVLVAALAVLCFTAAEKIERALGDREAAVPARRPRRVVFALFGVLACASLATLALPRAAAQVPPPPRAAAPGELGDLAQEERPRAPAAPSAEGGCP